jgi:hypothetical protein
VAVAVTKIAEEANPNNLATYPDSTASQPAAGSALLWGIWVHGGAGAPTINSVSAYGATWALLAAIAVGATGRLAVYEAQAGGAPTSTTPSIVLAQAGSGCTFAILQITGADPGDFTVQAPTFTGTGQTATATYAALADGANNAEVMFTGTLVNAVINPDADAGWTEQADLGHNSPTARLHAQSRIGTDLTATATWIGSAAWAAIGVEVKAAATVARTKVRTAAAGNAPVRWKDAGSVWRDVEVLV